MKKFVIFTDGSCNAKTKQGGYGVYFREPEVMKFSEGFCPAKTGRMEVMALMVALQQIPKKKKVRVIVFSDSQYVVRSVMEGWIFKWEAQGWTGRKNTDLWREIIKEIRKRPKMRFSIVHVKGHQKNMNDPLVVGNSIADELASYKNFETYIETDPSTWDN